MPGSRSATPLAHRGPERDCSAPGEADGCGRIGKVGPAMIGNQLRQRFLDFFARDCHAIVSWACRRSSVALSD